MNRIQGLGTRLHRMRSDERGASLVEYALLVALIALVCFVAVVFLGTETSESFDSNANSLFNG